MWIRGDGYLNFEIINLCMVFEATAALWNHLGNTLEKRENLKTPRHPNIERQRNDDLAKETMKQLPNNEGNHI